MAYNKQPRVLGPTYGGYDGLHQRQTAQKDFPEQLSLEEPYGGNIDARSLPELREEPTGYGEESMMDQWFGFPSLAQMALSATPGGDWGWIVLTKGIFEMFATAFFTFCTLFGAWYVISQGSETGVISDEEATTGTYTGTGGGIIFFPFFLFGESGTLALNLTPELDLVTFTLSSVVALSHAIIAGLSFAVAIDTFGYFSAEINPFYTFMMMLPPKRGMPNFFSRLVLGFSKIVGQFVGAFVSAALVLWVLGSGAFPPVTTPAVGFTDLESYLMLSLCTMFLFWVMATYQFNGASTGSKHPSISLGFIMLVLTLISNVVSGSQFNIAIYVAHGALAGGYPASAWVYIAGPATGSILALFAYRVVNYV